jgi:hypothetical protein
MFVGGYQVRNERKIVQAHVARLRRAPRLLFPINGGQLDCPHCQGVYLIIDPAGRVAHVGRTTRAKNGLVQRLKAHLAGRSSFVIKFLDKQPNKLRLGYSYSFIPVPDPRLRALVEAYATGMFCPLHIGTGETIAT